MSDAVDLTRALVQIDTAARGESVAAELLLDRLPSGAEVVVDPWRPGRSQFTARWPGDRTLTLTGHLDTVPADATAWNRDPWGAAVADGRIYGRGTSDMKAGLAVMVLAIQQHLQNRHRCAGIQLLATAAEETGCEGAHEMPVEQLAHGGPLVVAEPTSGLVRLGHKGATWLKLVVPGRAAHGSRPELGVNAAQLLAEAMVALGGADWPTHPGLGRVTVSVGTVHAGVQTNLVPDRAEATLDVRTVPGGGDGVLRRIEEIVRAVAADASVEITMAAGPIATDPDAEIVTIASGGDSMRVDGYATFFTDASALQRRLSTSGVVILGPGSADQAHTVDEYCEIAALQSGVGSYRRLLDRWCGTN